MSLPAARPFPRAIAWSTLANGINQLLPFLAALLLARTLPTAEYGQFLFLYSTSAALASLFGFSIGLTATRFIAANLSSNRGKAASLVTSSIKVAAAAVAVILAASLLTGQRPTILATALLFAVTVFNAVQGGILAGFQKFRDITTAGTVRLILGLAAAWWFARHGSVAGALAGLAIGGLAPIALNHGHILAAARQRHLRLTWTGPAHFPWKDFGIPAVLANSLVAPVIWLAQLALLKAHASYLEIAIFNIGLHWRNLIILLPSAIAQAATPFMTEECAADSLPPRSGVLRTNVAAGTGLALLAALGVATAAPIILAVYGKDYASAGVPVLRLAAFTSVLIAFNNALGSAIAAAGRMWTGFLFNALWAASVLLQLPLAAEFGALGVTAAISIAYVLHTGWQSIYMYATLTVNNRWKTSSLTRRVGAD